MLLNVFEATRSKCLYFDNKNSQKAISSGLPIFLEEAVAAHLGHQAYRWPLRDVASHVRDKQLLIWTLYPFGRLSEQEKWYCVINPF